MRTKHLLLLALLPLPALFLVVSGGAGCDFTNPDDFDAGPDGQTFPNPDASDASDAADAPSGFDASFDGASPFDCPNGCAPGTYCYGNIYLVAKDVLDGGDADLDATEDAGDDAAAQIGFACRALPPQCASDPSCACVGDAMAPACPGTVFCAGDAGLLVTCAQGGGP